jgi:hypothetical protein
VIFLFMLFSALSTRHSTLDTRPFSLDDVVRPVQHRLRNRQADLLGGSEIYHELELRRLLYQQVRGFGNFQNLIQI